MSASAASEKLRGAGPFPSAGKSHATTLSWDGLGPGQQRAGTALAQLSCDPAKTGEGFSFQEPPGHTDIAPHQSCFDRSLSEIPSDVKAGAPSSPSTDTHHDILHVLYDTIMCFLDKWRYEARGRRDEEESPWLWSLKVLAVDLHHKLQKP
ncbi:hypothetical protein DUI87_05390 [Hirundo rustica rustica]|uniref:Uncharacterized protein n=1 Tax=Hirundo rustica rustica TaxID=333673 RepID=A0A3M0KY34_HIRRU|nr:hypothetical protein DUI87_05390 [Hirundo rustica rustica]